MSDDGVKSNLILVAVVALVAGVIGGYIGSSAGGGDGSAHASDAAPPLRCLEDELELIEARGDQELRQAVAELVPTTLVVGSETLVYAPGISFERGGKLDVKFRFYRVIGDTLDRLDVKDD